MGNVILSAKTCSCRTAVAVGIFEQADAVGRVFQKFVGLEVQPGGLGHEEPAAIVEARHHRVLHQRRPGHQLDDEAVRDAKA